MRSVILHRNNTVRSMQHNLFMSSYRRRKPTSVSGSDVKDGVRLVQPYAVTE